MSDKTSIQSAVDHFDGKPSKLADAMGEGVLRQHVEHWLKSGRVPAEKCPAVERASSVTVEQLRPDVNWVRVPDADWPHPDGRPLVDFSPAVESA